MNKPRSHIRSQDRQAQSARLLAAIERVSAARDRKEILQTGAIQAVNLFDSDAAVISTWDSNRELIVMEAFHVHGEWRIPNSWYAPRPPAEHPLFQRVQSLGRGAQYNLAGMTVPLHSLKLMEKAGIQSWASFPMIGPDKTLFGVLDVLDSREPAEILEDEIAMGQLLARTAALACDRARLVAEASTSFRHFEALQLLIGSISSNTPYAEAMDHLAQAFLDVTAADICLISLYQPEKALLETQAYRTSGGFPPESEDRLLRDLASHPLALQVVRTREALLKRVTANDLPPESLLLLDLHEPQSLLILPLTQDGTTIGLVEIAFKDPVRTFDTREMDLLRTLAVAVVHSITRTQRRKDEEQERLFANALLEATRSLNSSLNFNELIAMILEHTITVLNCKSANIMLIEGDVARVVEHRGYESYPNARAELLNTTLPLKLHTFTQMMQTRKPVIIPHTSALSDWATVKGNEWIRSYAGAPLLVGDDVIGFINLDSDVEGFFPPSKTGPLEAFASISASILRNAQRYKVVEDRASELEIVRQASLSLAASLEIEDVLTRILKQSLDQFSGPRDGHIFLFQDNKLHFGAAMRGDGTTGEVWSNPREDGLTYTVARTGLPIIVDDMRKHPLFRNTPEDWVGSIIGLPLKNGGAVVGVMNIAHQEPYQFKDPQIRILRLLADQAAISIVNARLHNLVQEQSLRDPLTGLLNRRAFNQRLDEETQRSRRYDRPFSLALMDLNGFKKINDTYGHPTGDHILVRISACLNDNVRNTDFLARYGGDEFALIMPETNRPTAIRLTGRLQRALDLCDYRMPDSPVLPIKISIGLAQFPEDAASLESLIAAADDDLYQAKSLWRKSER